MKFLKVFQNNSRVSNYLKIIIKALVIFSVAISGIVLAQSSGDAFNFQLDQGTGEQYLKVGWSWARIVFFIMAVVGVIWAITIFFGRNKGEGWQWLLLYMIIVILSPKIVSWLSEHFGFGTGWLSSSPFQN